VSAPETTAPSAWAWDNLHREDAPGYERSDWQQDYELLRDTIIQAFNPPDEDVAEPSLMTDTLDLVWAYVVAQPCTCQPGAADFEVEPCDRCAVLGRAADAVVER
jgi:hypothetical protein